MKSKLVKYPFDEKKYRWDTKKMGKTFEYSWDATEPGDYDIINPYIQYETKTGRELLADMSNYAVIDMTDMEFPINQRNSMTYSINHNTSTTRSIVYKRPNAEYKVDGTLTASLISNWNMTNNDFTFGNMFPIPLDVDIEGSPWNDVWRQLNYDDAYNAFRADEITDNNYSYINEYGGHTSGIAEVYNDWSTSQPINQGDYHYIYPSSEAFIPSNDGTTSTFINGVSARNYTQTVSISSRTLYYSIVEYQFTTRLEAIELDNQPTLGIERVIYNSNLGSSKLANIAYTVSNNKYLTVRAVIGTHKTVVFGKNQSDCADGVARIQTYLNSYNNKTAQLVSNMTHVDTTSNEYATKITNSPTYSTIAIPNNRIIIGLNVYVGELEQDADYYLNFLNQVYDARKMTLIKSYSSEIGYVWFLRHLCIYGYNSTPYWTRTSTYKNGNNNYERWTWCTLAKYIVDNDLNIDWQLRCTENPIALTSMPTLGVFITSMPSMTFSAVTKSASLNKNIVQSFFYNTTTVSNIGARWGEHSNGDYRLPEADILTNFQFDETDHLIKTFTFDDADIASARANLDADDDYIINRLVRKYQSTINNGLVNTYVFKYDSSGMFVTPVYYFSIRISGNTVYLDVHGYECKADNLDTVYNNYSNAIPNDWITVSDIGNDPFSGTYYLAKYTDVNRNRIAGVLNSPCSFANPTVSASVDYTPSYLIDIRDWGQIDSKYTLQPVDINIANSTSIRYPIMKPVVKLIGNETDETIVIPEQNDSIYEYAIGELSGSDFNVKTLQTYVPKEYDENGNVVSRTWLTFNTYSSSQWLNGYHFTGNWNDIGSPYAYINAITEPNGDRTMLFQKSLCEAGDYKNIFTLWGDDTATIEDSLGNTLDASPEVFHDNCGSIWGGLTHIVKSTNRHAYPDNDTKDGMYYRLRPQDTTFIEYTVNPEEDETVNVELFSDRYHYTHNYTEWVDRSYEGTICGSASSTGEETIPDGTYRDYLGLYLGESIPFLNITEEQIPPSTILGVPEYDKQINTSDTLKYGTVAAASLTFVVDEPVVQAINHSNDLYVLYYDFFHNDTWKRMGFFRVDGVEAIDEYSSRITAHDEVYKLNKYADDFLENYSGSTTLDGFYRDLLDYCGCWYDTHGSSILNGSFTLDNVYHAIKTTGVEVAHYIAVMAPGFIQANIDGDIELLQYKNNSFELNPGNMTDIVYNAYTTDMLDKVRIVANNSVLGEDSGSGENIYFINNNPLISALLAQSIIDNLANNILSTYEGIQDYRPAEISMYYLPDLTTGDMPTVITPTGDVYKIAVMAINITASGVKIVSYGTQTYPVETENASQFVNLINDIDNISGDVDNLDNAVELMGQTVAQTVSDVSSLDSRLTATESTLASTVSTVSSISSTIGAYSLSTNSNLTDITLNGSTATNLVNKEYVEGNSGITVSSNLATISLFGENQSNIVLKGYIDNILGTSVSVKHGTLHYTVSSTNVSLGVFYIGTPDMNWGLYIPKAERYADCLMYRVVNGSLTSLNTFSASKEEWGDTPYTNVSFVAD